MKLSKQDGIYSTPETNELLTGNAKSGEERKAFQQIS